MYRALSTGRRAAAGRRWADADTCFTPAVTHSTHAILARARPYLLTETSAERVRRLASTASDSAGRRRHEDLIKVGWHIYIIKRSDIIYILYMYMHTVLKHYGHNINIYIHLHIYRRCTVN